MARTHAARPREIIWARHGETKANRDQRLKPPGEKLDEKGKAEARRLAIRAAAKKPDRILASPMPRAQQTARAVRDKVHAPVVTVPALRSRDYGDWAGRKISEVKSKLEAGATPPHGESRESVARRVRLAKSRIEKMPGRTMIVTHSSVLRAAHRPKVAPARFSVEKPDGR